MRKRYTGFTIIELMVVISIIGILATLVSVNVVGSKQRANYTKTLTDMDSISDAAKLYQEEFKVWPTSSTGSLPVEFTGLGSSSYLAGWPTPTCGSGYRYNWINVTEGAPVTVSRQGVVFQKVGGMNHFIYYFDVNNIGGYSAFLAQAGAPTNPLTVNSIQSVSLITCKEI